MFKKKSLMILLALTLSVGLVGCKKSEVKEEETVVEENEVVKEEGGKQMSDINQLKAPEQGEEIAIIKTSHGDIKLRLFPEVAPKAVENFKTHAKDGYYDEVSFHRVIKDFMIQGGDPEGTGRGGQSIWGAPFEDEFDMDHRNYRGALSMANAGPGTNGSQFFIVQANEVPADLLKQMGEIGTEGGFPSEVVEAYKEAGGTPWLDFKHTVFGQVYEGMEIVDQLANLDDGTSIPTEPAFIITVEFETI